MPRSNRGYQSHSILSRCRRFISSLLSPSTEANEGSSRPQGGLQEVPNEPVDATFAAGPSEPNPNVSMEYSKEKSFNDRLLDAVMTVRRDPVRDEHVPDNLNTLEMSTKSAIELMETTLVLTYRRTTVWNDVETNLKLLQDVWNKLREAVNDLRHYVSMNISSGLLDDVPSLESVYSEPNFGEAKNKNAVVLVRIIRTAYDAFQPQFIELFELLAIAFREEDNIVQHSSISCLSIAAQAVRLLGMVAETEQQLKSIQDNRHRVDIPESVLLGRKQALEHFVDEKCRFLESLQRTLFQPKHLYVKGLHSINNFKNMAEIMRDCWKESALIVRHLRKTCPGCKIVVQLKLGEVLFRAASLIAEMQDSKDLQDFLKESEPIEYEDNMISDIIRCQLWLLPCIKCIVKIAAQISSKLKYLVSHGEYGSEISDLFFNLKRGIYDVVMITVARASWLLSWTVRNHSYQLHDLSEQGSQTLLIAYTYNKGDLSLRCTISSPKEDMDFYGDFVYCTNKLRNGVLQVHRMIEQENMLTEVRGHPSDLPQQVESEESDIIRFHNVQGMDTLMSQVSLKTFPVLLEGSLEHYMASIKSDMTSVRDPEDILESADNLREHGISESQEVEGITRSDKHSSPESSLNKEKVIGEREGTSSIESLHMKTGFAEIQAHSGNDKGKQNNEFMMLVPSATEGTSGPSRVSPFITQMPSAPLSSPDMNKERTMSPVNPAKEESSTPSSHNRREGISPESTDHSDIAERVNAEELTEGKLIGRGAKGKVFKMSYYATPVAVKMMGESTRRNRRLFKEETRLHSMLSTHPNIVRFVGTVRQFQEPETGALQNLAMIMELCDSGDLFKAICDARWIQEKLNFRQNIKEYSDSPGYSLQRDWSLRIKVACDISAGMTHMHCQGIVHRDLTSYNVVLKRSDDEILVAKVCDFERSRELPHCGSILRSDTFANSPAWAAPEIIDNQAYSLPADVYSMGVILWELVTLKNPNEMFEELFRTEGISSHEKRKERLKDEFPKSPNIDLQTYEHIKKIVSHCINEEADNRPTMISVHKSLLEIKEFLLLHHADN